MRAAARPALAQHPRSRDRADRAAAAHRGGRARAGRRARWSSRRARRSVCRRLLPPGERRRLVRARPRRRRRARGAGGDPVLHRVVLPRREEPGGVGPTTGAVGCGVGGRRVVHPARQPRHPGARAPGPLARVGRPDRARRPPVAHRRALVADRVVVGPPAGGPGDVRGQPHRPTGARPRGRAWREPARDRRDALLRRLGGARHPRGQAARRASGRDACRAGGDDRRLGSISTPTSTPT